MRKLVIVGAVAAAAVLIAVPVVAQMMTPGGPGSPPAAGSPGNQSGPGWDRLGRQGFGWGPGMMMGPGMMGSSMMYGRGRGGMMCDPSVAGLAAWRVDRIERLVKPTDAQKTALDALRAASDKAAQAIVAGCPQELPVGAPARLELMEKRMDAMLQAIKTVRPAFDAFYATLTDEQKARMNNAGPRRWGWR